MIFHRVRTLPVLAAMLGTLVLAGCSRETEDWRSTQAADTTTSYELFLHQYPRSAHVNEANLRLAQLAEDEAWQGAAATDTQEGYQQFLGRYPEGKWAQEARVRVENFSLATPPAAVPAPEQVSAPDTPPAAVAPPVPAPKAERKSEPRPQSDKPKPVAARKKAAVAERAVRSGVGAQLGAFSSQEKADEEWVRLSREFKRELGGLKHQIQAGGSPALFRLRVPTAGASAARKLCSALKARHEVCVVYRP